MSSKYAPSSGRVTIEKALADLGPEPLEQEAIQQFIHPLFSKTLKNSYDVVYLANHSLGRMLDQTENDVLEGLNYWSYNRKDAWDHWFEEMKSYRCQVAALLHAEQADCIVPKTSAGQGLRAILNCFDQTIQVVTSADEFNSVDYILKAYAQRSRIELKQVKPGANSHYRIDDFLSILGEGTDLIVLSMVLFTTGQLLSDLKALIDSAHEQKTLVLLDLYHAAGVVPIDIADLDIDFAIGGSYKYLRGGPGAGWLYIHPRHLNGTLKTLDTGWFAQPLAFAFSRPEQPMVAEGGNAFLESTPAILPFYQARAGLKFTLGLGVDRLRTYSLRQQMFIENLLRQYDIPFLGKSEERGAFISIPHPQARNVTENLGNEGITCDCRENLIRICPDLLNTEEELTKAIRKMSEFWIR